ncbi:MAG: copper amine oxidase N-terminal domain-containing protein [Tissierellia bacterium]|nr:copper amine oxidase N-terminal domain-containing protein [Tissierellia bacterium]
MKKIILVLLASIMVLLPIFAKAETEAKVTVYVEGKLLEPVGNEKIAILKDSRTFVPLRAVSEALDYDVEYKAEDKSITISEDDTELIMHVGNKEYTINGEKKTMDVKPFIEDDRTYVPIRFIAEALGEEVGWDQQNRIVTIGQYADDDDDDEVYEKKEFRDLKIGFKMKPEDFRHVFFERRQDSILFFDKVNHRSKDGGLICTVLISDKPMSDKVVPGILLDSYNGIYVEALFASDVQYNPHKPNAEKIYNESVERVKDILETYYRLP